MRNNIPHPNHKPDIISFEIQNGYEYVVQNFISPTRSMYVRMPTKVTKVKVITHETKSIMV